MICCFGSTLDNPHRWTSWTVAATGARIQPKSVAAPLPQSLTWCTRNKRESFERFRMMFPNIDLLLTNRADTLVQVAKAFTDYTEADYHLVMNTDLSSFFYIMRQVSP